MHFSVFQSIDEHTYLSSKRQTETAGAFEVTYIKKYTNNILSLWLRIYFWIEIVFQEYPRLNRVFCTVTQDCLYKPGSYASTSLRPVVVLKIKYRKGRQIGADLWGGHSMYNISARKLIDVLKVLVKNRSNASAKYLGGLEGGRIGGRAMRRACMARTTTYVNVQQLPFLLEEHKM